MYARDEMVYRTHELLPRLLLWFSLSVPTMCVILTMQLKSMGEAARGDASWNRRTIARLALIGLAAAILCMVWYTLAVGSTARSALFEVRAIPHLLLLLLGFGVQLYGWRGYGQAATNRAEPDALTPPSSRVMCRGEGFFGRFASIRWIAAGNLSALIAVSSLREIVRISRVDFASAIERHRKLGAVGGWAVFVLFLLVNTAAIAAVIRLVRKRIPSSP
jgi:hypothetical protein